MAALRTVLADHVLTVPQRFLDNTHKQDWILSLLIVGGSFSPFFFFFPRKIKNLPHQAAMSFFFLTPCVNLLCLHLTKGSANILGFISRTGYFYSFFTSIPSQDNHTETCQLLRIRSRQSEVILVSFWSVLGWIFQLQQPDQF